MAAPFTRYQEALVHQLLEGQHHRAACNAEFFRQDAAGGQWHRGGYLPVEDCGDDRLPDLRLQGLARFRGDVEKA